MRLPYAPSTPLDPSPEYSAIYERIATRRAPRPLIPLDLALLHSPPVADGWNAFLGAIRTGTSVDAGLLELAVCRIAVLNEAVYEWNAHAPLALKGGVTPDGLRTVQTAPPVSLGDEKEDGHSGNETDEGRTGAGLNRQEWAVLAYTDQMTKSVTVEERVFAELRAAGLTERDTVELTAGIAAYNCVSRFLVALDVGEWNGKEMKSVEELVEAAERAKQSQ